MRYAHCQLRSFVISWSFSMPVLTGAEQPLQFDHWGHYSNRS